ncbi:MAG: hypothetical protein AB7H88_17305 [Vicinamibacterales bacterium]
MRGAAATLVLTLGALAAGQEPGAPAEVRQIVSFHLLPGTPGVVDGLYRDQLLPIYQDIAPLLRFRAYREAESPEPVDLVVVSAYEGMAGMDAANALLRRPGRNGVSALSVYGQIARYTSAHTDQFVEMRPRLSDPVADQRPDGLAVFEYVHLVPAAHAAYEQLLEERVRGWEKEHAVYQWSETGRMLVSDGWDYLRTYGMRSLADWQDYQSRLGATDFAPDLAALVGSRKTLILRGAPDLSVR